MTNDSTQPPRIYLDNAATSWPKPEAVYTAIDRYMRQLGAPAGRGAYAEGVEVTAAVEAARRRIAQLVGLADPTHLIFTSNGTDSLNLVLHGLLRPGDHVVTTVVEHNSVLRPLEHLQRSSGVQVTRVACDAAGVVHPEEIQAALRPATRLVAISHASNVTGAIQPVAAVAKLARQAGVLTLCDAAQTLGHLPINLTSLGVDYLAASGHKGLLGPLGTGIVAIRPGSAHWLDSVRQGGTGTRSETTQQPDDLPAKFEAGNLNVPGILGMAAGAEYLQSLGLETIEKQGQRLTARLLAELANLQGVRVFGPARADQRVPLVSLVLAGYDPQEAAISLDAAYRIQVRPGLHCAPAMHAALGTDQTGGTLRLSLGVFTTEAEIDATIAAIGELVTSETGV
jgi:cysteine desulfurase / selenocysteine lyase